MMEHAPFAQIDDDLGLATMPTAAPNIGSWQKLWRDLVLVALSVAAANTGMKALQGRGAEPLPAQTAPAPEQAVQLRLKEAGSSVEKLIALLDHDDFDTREAAQQAIIALAKDVVARTKKSPGWKKSLEPGAQASAEVRRRVADILAEIELIERVLRLPGSVFRAPAKWKGKSEKPRMTDVLKEVFRATGQPIYMGNAGIGFLHQEVDVNGLDGLTYMQILTRLDVHVNAVSHGHSYVFPDTSPHPKIIAHDGAVRGILKQFDNHPHHNSLSFDIEPGMFAEGWSLEKLTMTLPGGKELPLTPDAIQGEGLTGPGFVLPQAAGAGEKVIVKATVVFTVQPQKHLPVKNLNEQQTFTEETYGIHYRGIRKSPSGFYDVVAKVTKGSRGFHEPASSRIGCIAYGADGLPLIVLSATEDDAEKGERTWQFLPPAENVVFTVPLYTPVQRTAELIFESVPLSPKEPIR